MPPSKWDDASERQMLLALIHLNPPTRVSFGRVGEMLDADFTGEAIRQKYMKLKKAAGAQWGNVEVDGGEGKTPVKRGGGKKAAGETKTGSAKRKAKKDVDEGGEPEENSEESPSKKVKVERSGENEDEV
ncbi:hypothetical protein M409DRAFT_19093 [Zasmidium cellare ATCC 36951]|uniref:Myb-like domain-containing protein n=1 Tax=Zasmidium cellare ATCC 36951 TaxID=1080233 RepID=A0A6A6CZ11_ZASCE|nr:uncharacterized protein M409DRAFT_19093 [Zasmidium cellare ATCC 36951]KAF2171122.1 hypothetical protein M409DRAFT_19093 [Zasmidium cellare ATCC 36951]